MKRIFLIAVLLVGCAGKEVREAKAPERTLYERGNRSLSDKEYKESAEFYSKLLADYPATKWLTTAYYNWGAALEAMGNFEEAADKYKKVTDYYQGMHTKEEANALYRLANCYEELGQDEKLIVTLLQLKQDLKYFPKEVAESEWPSRLAGAYARLEQTEQSQKYYLMAEASLKKLMNTKAAFIWLPKTYYSMGRLPSKRLEFKTIPEFNTLLGTIEKSQIWLLKAMETKVKPWNEKAAADLINTYTRCWAFVENPPSEDSKDSLIAQKKFQETKKALAVKLDSVIQNLKSKHDGEVSDATIDKFFEDLRPLELKIDALISQRDVQDQDTKESKKLKGPRIDGKLVP